VHQILQAVLTLMGVRQSTLLKLDDVYARNHAAEDAFIYIFQQCLQLLLPHASNDVGSILGSETGRKIPCRDSNIRPLGITRHRRE
jgi:hypothetical protein